MQAIINHTNINHTKKIGIVRILALLFLFGAILFVDLNAVAQTKQADTDASEVSVASEVELMDKTILSGSAVEKTSKSWLATYNPSWGMCNASVFTTVVGAAMVAFFIAICWGKLVEAVGPLGGVIGGGVIVGTFWILNHKLPGVGINPGCVPHPDGFGSHQFGLIVQAFHSTGPWIDMSLAVCVGLFVCSFLERLKAKKQQASLPGIGGLSAEVLPRVCFVILGGILGGIIVGMIGFTGAEI